MIFVVLGTHELPFARLVKEVDRLKKNGTINEDVVVQVGNTRYESDDLTIIPFMSYDDMNELYARANLIITHGGTGSIITGVKNGKKVIAAARLTKYGEHNDDHQTEIVKQFVDNQHILEWHEDEPMEEVLKRAETFQPREYKSGKEGLIRLLDQFIQNS